MKGNKTFLVSHLQSLQSNRRSTFLISMASSVSPFWSNTFMTALSTSFRALPYIGRDVTQPILQFTFSTILLQEADRYKFLFQFYYPNHKFVMGGFQFQHLLDVKISSFSLHQDNPKNIPNYSLQRKFNVCNTLKLQS